MEHIIDAKKDVWLTIALDFLGPSGICMVCIQYARLCVSTLYYYRIYFCLMPLIILNYFHSGLKALSLSTFIGMGISYLLFQFPLCFNFTFFSIISAPHFHSMASVGFGLLHLGHSLLPYLLLVIWLRVLPFPFLFVLFFYKFY